MLWLLLLLLLSCLPAQSSSAEPIEVARKYIGLREIPSNRGPMVEIFQASVGIPPGAPWCAAFVRWVLDNSNKKCFPIRSPLARKYITRFSVPAKFVAKGYRKVSSNFLAVWKRGNNYNGHIGFVVSWNLNSGFTIEGNTRPDDGSPPDGVFLRSRSIFSHSNFRIIYFTPLLCGKL